MDGKHKSIWQGSENTEMGNRTTTPVQTDNRQQSNIFPLRLKKVFSAFVPFYCNEKGTHYIPRKKIGPSPNPCFFFGGSLTSHVATFQCARDVLCFPFQVSICSLICGFVPTRRYFGPFKTITEM